MFPAIPHFGYSDQSCQSYTHEKGNILGENPRQFRCLHFLEDQICPYPKKLASHNSMEKKDDEVGNKTANKTRKAKEKRQRERKIEKDQIFAFAHA